jgi:hypothetical protein
MESSQSEYQRIVKSVPSFRTIVGYQRADWGVLNKGTSQIHAFKSTVGQERGIDTIQYIMQPIVRIGDAIRQQRDTKSVLSSQLSIHASDQE